MSSPNCCVGEKCMLKATGRSSSEILLLPPDPVLEQVYERCLQLATPYHPQNGEEPSSDYEFRILIHATYNVMLSSINQYCRHKQCRELEYLLRDFSCLESCLQDESHEGHCFVQFYLNILGNFYLTFKNLTKQERAKIQYFFLSPSEVKDLGRFYDALLKLQVGRYSVKETTKNTTPDSATKVDSASSKETKDVSKEGKKGGKKEKPKHVKNENGTKFLRRKRRGLPRK